MPEEKKSLQETVDTLKQNLEALSQSFFQGNFITSQDFNKYCRFNTRMKVPHFSTLPTVCEVGEIAEASGKLYVCSVANTWTIVGTQS